MPLPAPGPILRRQEAGQDIRRQRSVRVDRLERRTTAEAAAELIRGLELPDDAEVIVLGDNATNLSVSEVIELYSLRWQIELFFKELKSTLGFSQYRFQKFDAMEAWANTAITTVLFPETERAKRMQDRRLSMETRQWWATQRLHGLCTAYREECDGREPKSMADRLKTSGGIAKLKQLLAAALPIEFRAAG